MPNAFWSGFAGYLHTDGYQGYSALISKPGVTSVHCMAHARRKFMDIVKATKKIKRRGLAHEAIDKIAEIYEIEKRAKLKKLSFAEIKLLRDKESAPLLEDFKKWLDEKINQVITGHAIEKAILYSLKYWDNLTHYLDDGRLDIDNNLAERAIKPFATGRKNWLFSDSQRGAKASAAIYSLIETCKHHGIDTYAYFKVLLERIRYCETDEDFAALLPFNIDLS